MNDTPPKTLIGFGAYNMSQEEIESMIKSGVPDEIVKVTFIENKVRLLTEFKTDKVGWWIRVERKIYGEYHIHDSFVAKYIVDAGPSWVEHHHQLIDAAFEAARVEHPRAKH